MKMPAVSSINVPAVLAGCWDIMNLHFLLSYANQIYFSQETSWQGTWPTGSSHKTDFQRLRTVSFPGCSLGVVRSLEWKLIPGQVCGVWPGLVTQLWFTPAIAINLPGLLHSCPLLDHYLGFRRLSSALFLVPSVSVLFYHLFRLFSFLKEKKVE